MPSTKKTLHFLFSALMTSISVGLMGYGISTEWAVMSIQCARNEGDIYNGTAEITWMLFGGSITRSLCPFFGNTEKIDVFKKITEIGAAPQVLHVLVVVLCALCLLFSATSIFLSLYNSVSNPYETYMGPTGVYTCSSLSACLSVLALILFVVNVKVTNLAEAIVVNFADGSPVYLKNKSVELKIGYFLLMPYTVLCLISIGLIYTYDHAAYTQRKEQQRPTEDAPKEIMMY
ncbi:clarin-3 [Thalassophryne amazonica]|uniref:clarin-3 n=1 Tax=Thalassophryne amazonica TaxID=390379 RepID=UPI0014718DAB|nr:clarin-3 [Thalassophryne amazonica]